MQTRTPKLYIILSKQNLLQRLKLVRLLTGVNAVGELLKQFGFHTTDWPPPRRPYALCYNETYTLLRCNGNSCYNIL
jgi:hypothetical protein